LRKSDKLDYTLPKAYQPISLLITLSKIVEAIVAERISYLVETYNLLSENYFEARNGRSTAQALTTIQKQHIKHEEKEKF
jgi:hypothetical protein